MLVKTLAAEDKYHILNREMLTVTIQMKLSQKPKAFSEFFPPFFKYRLNLEYLERRDDPHRFSISEITD